MGTILITGANRGLGLEFVRQYLETQHEILACCRTPEAATELQALKLDAGERLRILSLDVSDEASMDAFIEDLDVEAIDVLINNAGVYGHAANHLGTIDSRAFLKTLQINSVAPIYLTQGLLPKLRAGSARRLVFVTSQMGSIADNSRGGVYAYRASKAALNAAVRSLAFDLDAQGFFVLLVHPGWVRTDMGGPNAPCSVEDSISGMMALIERADPRQSGEFLNYRDEVLPW